MATVVNRSRIQVSVPRHPEHTRQFSSRKAQNAAAYVLSLQGAGLQPRYEQLQDEFLVRIREKGYPPIARTFSSEAEAQAFVEETRVARRKGTFRDDTASVRNSFADILQRYILEEGADRNPKSWLPVVKPVLSRILRYAQRAYNERDTRAIEKATVKDDVATRTHKVEEGHAWMNRPLAALTSSDIQRYLRFREKVMHRKPATIKREMEMIVGVFNVAKTAWHYVLPDGLIEGVDRPEVHNGVVRRISRDEMKGLVAAAFEEDRDRCCEAELKTAVKVVLSAPGAPAATRYRVLSLRRGMRDAVSARCAINPLLATFVLFQIATTARRGEALKLLWEDVRLDEGYARLRDTKNGDTRDVPLTATLVEALRAMPRIGPRVFPLSRDYLQKAWHRILERAGIKDLRIHDMRHEGISWYMECKRFSETEVMMISGHKDPRMLRRYTHMNVSKLAERMGNELRSQDHPLLAG